MAHADTIRLLSTQGVCAGALLKSFVSADQMDLQEAGRWLKQERERRGLTQVELAARISGILREAGSGRTLKQQSVDQVEKVKLKSIPDWYRYAAQAFESKDEQTDEDPYLGTGTADDGVLIKLLPTFAGMGSGGTGEGDEGKVSFSRDLIERELRAPAGELLAMIAEGNSMEPEFKGGDQILVDTRRKSLSQPGAFCLWDGDGHVIKYLEKVPGSDPQRVRVISEKADLYPANERLVDEIGLVGRVVWFGRRVQ